MNHLVQFVEFATWVSIVYLFSIFLFCQLCISKPKSLFSGNGVQFANTACIVPKLSIDIVLGGESFWIVGLQELVFNTNSSVTKFPSKILEFPSFI